MNMAKFTIKIAQLFSNLNVQGTIFRVVEPKATFYLSHAISKTKKYFKSPSRSECKTDVAF